MICSSSSASVSIISVSCSSSRSVISCPFVVEGVRGGGGELPHVFGTGVGGFGTGVGGFDGQLTLSALVGDVHALDTGVGGDEPQLVCDEAGIAWGGLSHPGGGDGLGG